MGREPWQAMFGRAVDKTFNRVSVDGDTSTNDTILGLANGASGVAARDEADLALLEEALTAILGTVSHMLVMDGEGASKVIHISVRGARNDADAELVARSVGHSQLVKTAIYGGDASWGPYRHSCGLQRRELRSRQGGPAPLRRGTLPPGPSGERRSGGNAGRIAQGQGYCRGHQSG